MNDVAAVVQTEVNVQIVPKLIPVFMAPKKRFRGAFGGRGSGKTRTFAKMAAIKAYELSQEGREGIILCAREYMNSLDESSMSEIKAAIFSEPWLAVHFDIGEKYIRTKDKRIEFKFVGLAKNIDSVKSKSQIHLCWIDEAEPVTETAWMKLIPTVREHGSEIWVTWNPESKRSSTHLRFREHYDEDEMIIVEVNWRDNPWFPEVLNQDRRRDKLQRPEQYDHVWEGDFVTVVEGAYYADCLKQAQKDGRICDLYRDPVIRLRAFWDIGGNSDSTAIWIAQFIAREIRVFDYYESVGQELSFHLNWLTENGYGKALCVLPHDGSRHDLIHNIRYEDHIRSSGFEVQTIPNQGKGAALKRVEAARRLFPRILFQKGDKTFGGREALGFYHEKRDEVRRIGLGPNHDWSSHGADAFGLMCVAYQEPYLAEGDRMRRGRPTSRDTWMTA